MSDRTLSEHESKTLLREAGVPCGAEELASTPDEAAAAAERIGFPVVAKLCGRAIAHKSERNLVRLGLRDSAAVRAAAEDLLARATDEDGDVGVLVGEMVSAKRELIAGFVRDPQFGPCVVIGLGGILTEALQDVAFAAAPLTRVQARALLGRLRTSALITEPFRGEPAGDLDAIADVLVALGDLAVARPDIASVDVNPLLLRDGKPVAVDALVEISPEPAAPLATRAQPPSEEELRARFQPLFEPRGIVIAGVSSHPGKFGFVTFHNLMRFGYDGELFPVTRDGGDIMGYPTLSDISQVPEGAADLVFVCTPYQANVELLKACRARGGARRVHRERWVRRSRRRGSGAAARTRRPRERSRHGRGGPERPGRDLDRALHVRPDRGSVSAGGRHWRRQPERQPRLEFPELRGRVGRRCLEGDLGRQLGADGSARLSRILRGRPGYEGGARLPRGAPGRSPLRRSGPLRQ